MPAPRHGRQGRARVSWLRLAWVLLVLSRASASAQVLSQRTSDPIPVQCVTADGSAFESCGGTGSAGLTNTELRASAVPVSGTLTCNAGSGTLAVSGPLTDTQLRASAVPVSGTFWQATQPISGTVTANAGSGTMAVSGPITDAQIRATPLPVSGAFYPATQPVSGTLTCDVGAGTQAVSGTVTANAGSGTFAVSGPLTDTQLRASAVPV